MNKINYKKIFLIVIISFSAGIFYKAISGNSIPWIREEIVIDKINSENDAHETNIKSISLANFFEFLDDDNLKIIDARDQWDFAEGHIKGAINIPEYSFEPEQIDSFPISKTDKLIIYCGADDCDLSKRLALKLQKLNFQHIFIFLAGYEVWLNAGLPTETCELNE